MNKKYIGLLAVIFVAHLGAQNIQKRLAVKAVCAPGVANLTASQAKKLLPGSIIAGKSFELVDPKTKKKRTCFLLIQKHKETTPAQEKQASQQIDSTLNPAFDIGVDLEGLGIKL